MRLLPVLTPTDRRRLSRLLALAVVVVAIGLLRMGSEGTGARRAAASPLELGDARAGMAAAVGAAAQLPLATDTSSVPELWWDAMGELNYETGEMPDSLRALDGQLVRIPGFMVPLDDYSARVKEFLLVPYAGACVHVPPPPPNYMVYAGMGEGKLTEVVWWDPIWVEGRLRIESTENVYGAVGYQLEVTRIEPYVEPPR